MNVSRQDTAGQRNQVFVPSESPGSFFSTFVARVDGPAEDHLAEIRDGIQSVDAQVPVFGVKTMQQRLDEVFARPRFYRTAVWILAGFAFVLVLIGIHGIVSYSVVQRTREIGVRMARYTTPSARDADISEFVDCCSWGTSRGHSVPAYGTVLGGADRRGDFCGSYNVVRFGFCFSGSCGGEYLDGDTEACKAGCGVGAAHRVGKLIRRSFRSIANS
jgi:hypothetical protein